MSSSLLATNKVLPEIAGLAKTSPPTEYVLMTVVDTAVLIGGALVATLGDDVDEVAAGE